ncbi:MAG: hypothetical protein EBZ48_07475 [Proteobacteria bacterium]|nr:hypothetical protein [Pseudomonadota bacterium]
MNIRRAALTVVAIASQSLSSVCLAHPLHAGAMPNQLQGKQVAPVKTVQGAPKQTNVKVRGPADRLTGAFRPIVYPDDARMPRAERIRPRTAPAFMGYAMRRGCDLSSFALNISFADYSIDPTGVTRQDGGWTAAERELISGFLCNMLPIIEELYGAPFAPYRLTLIRDLYNTSSSMFAPRERAIYTGPNWNPQLLTHELVHAFRGDWTLTTANNYSRYSPKLSGYEEGFAQAVSYDAMNQYLDIYGADQYLGQRWNRLWTPESEWNYDFKNDSSMITEDFWSDVGGTRKYFERYEQAAAAIQKLATRIPDFYRRFNDAYYREVRSNPGYLPTKERIDTLIASLADPEVTRWLAEQKVLECRTTLGKKIWTTSAPSNPVEPLLKVHFVETFPSGYEWYYTVPNQGYLLHRLNGVSGTLSIMDSWSGDAIGGNQSIVMKNDPRWDSSAPICYLNCTYGFGAEQLLLLNRNITLPPGPVSAVRQPSLPGLYELLLSYRNPHFRSSPLYGISYDSTQPDQRESLPQILGLSSAEFAAHQIFGGVLGLPGGVGTVTIRREDSPSLSITVPIERGLFKTPGDPSWFTTARDGSSVISRPGTLSFEISDTNGTVVSEQRQIRFGNFGGKHQFLFKMPSIGDFNRDGSVDGLDVEAFFQAWEAGELRADLNHDGGVTSDDVEVFFRSWESGGTA